MALFYGFEVPEDKKLFVCDTPFTTFREVPPSRQGTTFKPQGLWYACGSEWVEWLQNEMPDWYDESRYLYEVDVDDSMMAVLRTTADVDSFDHKYAINRHGYQVNWTKVARSYTGIEICPYQRKLRHTLSWYNPWDVASGCVWSAHAIRSVSLIYER